MHISKKHQREIYKAKCILNLLKRVIIVMGNVEHAFEDFKISD